MNHNHTQNTKRYPYINRWQIRKTKQGLKAADEGLFVSNDEMTRIFNKYKTSSVTNADIGGSMKVKRMKSALSVTLPKGVVPFHLFVLREPS